MSTASVERAHELVDRALHRARLLGDRARARRRPAARCCDARDLARRAPWPSSMTSPPLRHRDAEPERLLAHVAHLLLRRIDVAAVDASRCRRGGTARSLARIAMSRIASTRVERAGGAHVDAVGRRCRTRPAAATAFCCGSVCEDLRGLDAERGELGVRHLDEDLLVLLADEVDLGDAGHAQQLGADAVAEVLQLARSRSRRRSARRCWRRCRRTRR